MTRTATNPGPHFAENMFASRQGVAYGYGYKLADAGNYGLAVAIDSPDIDENRMSLTFPFADGRRRDGVGDLLEIGGIRTDRHRLNPVVLFDHGKALALPIAKAEDPDSHEYTVYLDPQTQSATCKAFFYQGQDEHGLFCEQLFDLVSKRYVRAGSIGFTVVAAKELPPNYETGTPKGLHLISVNMLEASIVVMPANQDTVRKALSLNRVCGKPLSPVLVKSLSPYAGERKVQLGYEGKSMCKLCGMESCTCPVPTGNLSDTDVPPARWKPGLGAMKDIGDIRRKYRKTKSVRRRLKKSAPGSSMVYLNGKDLKAAKEMAEAKGLKFARVGVKGDLEKVKLTGDDDAIDQVAKQYGKPLRGIKHMAAKVTNTKEVRLVQKTKDLDPNPVPGDEAVDQVMDDATPDTGGIDIPPERYSAQVSRRVHECFRILMAELDAMMGPLENDEYKAFVEDILAVCEETLTGVEALHDKYHKDLPGLDGAMTEEDEMDSAEEEAENDADDAIDSDKDMDGAATDAVPADSVSDNPDEDTTDEEVAQAMMDKALKRVPSIRLKVRQKFFTGDKDKDKGKKALTEDEVTDIKEEIDTQATDTEADPVEESTSAEGKGMLKAHELAQCKGAVTHLKEVSETNDWDDEWRMKSYHYHKVLDEIGTADPDGVQPVDSLNGGPAADNSDAYGNKNMEADGEGYHKEMPGEPHPHRKTCKNCSGFLGRLAHEKAFGDIHREEALVHLKDMGGMVTSYDQQADLPDMPEEPQQEETSQEDVPIGDVQEKRLSKLEAMLTRLETVLN